MGTIYLGVCDVCKEYINLDKFFDWCPLVEGESIIIDIADASFHVPSFIERSLRLHAFMRAHEPHAIRVTTDTVFDDMADYRPVFPWSAMQRIDKKEAVIEMARAILERWNNQRDVGPFMGPLLESLHDLDKETNLR